MTDPQRDNLDRVRERIHACVVAFWSERLTGDPVFTATDLRAYVETRHSGIAPDSPSRILRLLRQAGSVNYVVESRSASRYRAITLSECPPEDPVHDPAAEEASHEAASDPAHDEERAPMNERESRSSETTGGLWRYAKDPKLRRGKYLVLHRGDGSPLTHPNIVIGAKDPAAPAALRSYAKAARALAVTSGLGLPVWVVLRRNQTMPEWPFVVLHGADPMAPYGLDGYADECDRLGYHPDYGRDIRRLAGEMRAHLHALHAESEAKRQLCGAALVSMLGTKQDADVGAANVEFMARQFEVYMASNGPGNPSARPTDPDEPAVVAAMEEGRSA